MTKHTGVYRDKKQTAISRKMRHVADHSLYKGLKINYKGQCTMDRLSDGQRIFIVEKHKQGLGYRKIKKEFEAKYPRTINKSSIIKLVKKERETGSIVNRRRKVTNCKAGREQMDFLDACINERPYSTAKELGEKIFDRFQISLSKSRICALRLKLGWVQSGNRYCQLIRDVNKVKRVDWCQAMIQNQETFDVSL